MPTVAPVPIVQPSAPAADPAPVVQPVMPVVTPIAPVSITPPTAPMPGDGNFTEGYFIIQPVVGGGYVSTVAGTSNVALSAYPGPSGTWFVQKKGNGITFLSNEFKYMRSGKNELKPKLDRTVPKGHETYYPEVCGTAMCFRTAHGLYLGVAAGSVMCNNTHITPSIPGFTAMDTGEWFMLTAVPKPAGIATAAPAETPGLLTRAKCLVGFHKGDYTYDQPGSCAQTLHCTACSAIVRRTHHHESIHNPQYLTPGSCHRTKLCQRCGHTESAGEVHQAMGPETWAGPGSCTRMSACGRCGSVKTREDHAYGPYQHVSPSNCATIAYCVRCGSSKSGPIEHRWTEWRVVSHVAVHPPPRHHPHHHHHPPPPPVIQTCIKERRCMHCGLHDRL